MAPLAWLGDLSYSLYLWHWPLLVLGPTYSDHLTGVPGTLLLLLATLVAALVTFRLVENPLRRNQVLRPGRRSLALWPVAIAAVALAVMAAEREATALLEARMAGTTSRRPHRSDRPPTRPRHRGHVPATVRSSGRRPHGRR